MEETLFIIRTGTVKQATYAPKQTDGDHLVYIQEVNPRTSRTSPFVSKTTNIPLQKIAAKIMAGMNLVRVALPCRVETSVRRSSLMPVRRPLILDEIYNPTPVQFVDANKKAGVPRKRFTPANHMKSESGRDQRPFEITSFTRSPTRLL
ncbi:MAG: hypothetical protein U0941_04945 [Planctomycetaceae bacterium]